MSILSAFLGSSARRAASGAADAYNTGLRTGQRDATGQLVTGYNQANGFLGDAARTADQHINREYGNAINTTFETGRNALDSLGTAYNTGRADLNSGFDRGVGAFQTGMDAARSYLQPYNERGQQYNNILANALGANGQPAAQEFYQNYANNDPFRAENEALANRSILAQMNAQGNWGGDGRSSLAVSRASLERGAQDMNRYLDRITRGAEFGAQTGAQLGDLSMRGSQGIAGLESARGTALSGLADSYGRNSANVWQTTGTNAANLATRLGDANANNAWMLGQGQNRNRSDLAASLANLDFGVESGIGRNTGQNYLAQAAAEQQGVNNIIGLGSLIASAATGIPMTRSPTSTGASNGSTGAAPSSYGGYPGFPMQF